MAAGAGGRSPTFWKSAATRSMRRRSPGSPTARTSCSKDTSLDTHITDIVNLFKWEDITDACLVPHSYGGWPCSGALEQIGDRVASIVWLDAFMPKDGERQRRHISEFSRKAMVEAVAQGEPGRKPPKASQYSISEKDYDWMNSKLTPQPNAMCRDRDQAHRRAAEGGEEDLHPRAEISAGRVRQGVGGMQGRPELDDLCRRQLAPRRDDRSAGMAGGGAIASIVNQGGRR